MCTCTTKIPARTYIALSYSIENGSGLSTRMTRIPFDSGSGSAPESLSLPYLPNYVAVLVSPISRN